MLFFLILIFKNCLFSKKTYQIQKKINNGTKISILKFYNKCIHNNISASWISYMIYYSLRYTKMLKNVTHSVSIRFCLQYHIYFQIWVIKLPNFTIYFVITLKLKVFNINIMISYNIIL